MCGRYVTDRTPSRGKQSFALMRWGLPTWVKDPKAFSLLINAHTQRHRSPFFHAGPLRPILAEEEME